MSAIKGQVVPARELVPGDRIILPMLGSRVILEAGPSTFGTAETACIRIIYGLGDSFAFENRSRSRGPSSVKQPTAGVRPLDPDEPIAIERRKGCT